MSKTDDVKRTLDGVTFRGRVPVLTEGDRPDLAGIIERFGDLTESPSWPSSPTNTRKANPA